MPIHHAHHAASCTFSKMQQNLNNPAGYSRANLLACFVHDLQLEQVVYTNQGQIPGNTWVISSWGWGPERSAAHAPDPAKVDLGKTLGCLQ